MEELTASLNQIDFTARWPQVAQLFMGLFNEPAIAQYNEHDSETVQMVLALCREGSLDPARSLQAKVAMEVRTNRMSYDRRLRGDTSPRPSALVPPALGDDWENYAFTCLLAIANAWAEMASAVATRSKPNIAHLVRYALERAASAAGCEAAHNASESGSSRKNLEAAFEAANAAAALERYLEQIKLIGS